VRGAWLTFVLAACTPAPVGLVPLEEAPRFALVYSDYSSTSIGLYDEALAPLAADWVNSGSRVPILVTPVTADAVLPSVSLGRLAWIDRFPADVLTLVDPRDPATLVQLDVQGEGPATAWIANPHDALPLPDGRLLVSRHNPDLAPGIERGNDLLAIDPVTRASERIALGCDAGRFFARPDRMTEVRPGGRRIVVVALARLDAPYEAAGQGAIATLDPTSLEVLGCHELPGASNCQDVRAEPGTEDRVLVLCTGQPRRAEALRREEASVLALRVDALGGALIEERLDARDLPLERTPAAHLIPLGAGRALVTADGRGPDPLSAGPDRLLWLDLTAGRAELLAETEPFQFGAGILDGDVALVPDGATNEILRVERTGGAILDRVAVPTPTGLPLRIVGAL